MGLPYPPSYLNPRSQGPVILQGLNYASAAGGILDSTGYNYVSFFANLKPLLSSWWYLSQCICCHAMVFLDFISSHSINRVYMITTTVMLIFTHSVWLLLITWYRLGAYLWTSSSITWQTQSHSLFSWLEGRKPRTFLTKHFSMLQLGAMTTSTITCSQARRHPGNTLPNNTRTC